MSITPVVPALIMCFTLILNTYWTWNLLPYFPIEFSQMGWGAPGKSGGYYIMAAGTQLSAMFMMRVHVEEVSYVGMLGAVCMGLLGLVNGNDTPLLQVAHGIVAFACFVLYIVYIYINRGPMMWVCIGALALVLGHALVLTQLDFADLWNNGPTAWPRVWTSAQDKHPVWVLRLKALFQSTMIVALFAGYFITVARKSSKAA